MMFLKYKKVREKGLKKVYVHLKCIDVVLEF